jgi:hypothetical protein
LQTDKTFWEVAAGGGSASTLYEVSDFWLYKEARGLVT